MEKESKLEKNVKVDWKQNIPLGIGAIYALRDHRKGEPTTIGNYFKETTLKNWTKTQTWILYQGVSLLTAGVVAYNASV